MRYVFPSAVSLSTYFVGNNASVTPTRPATQETGNEMPLDLLDPSTRDGVVDALKTRNSTTWAQCTDAPTLVDAPLPCRTGDVPARCISGQRYCADTASNTQEPFLEVDMRGDVPTDRDYYFFAIEFVLPDDSEYGALFFESAYDASNRHYSVAVFDELHHPLSTQCKPFFEQSVDHYTDGLVYLQYVCLDALASDAAYAAMRHVRYVRLTLTGAFRMIWLKNVRVMFRTVQELPPSPPPSPTAPPAPPSPVAPPDQPDRPTTHTCTPHAHVSFEAAYVTLVHEEPCGLTSDECCQLAYEHNDTRVFTLSASGCCTLYERVDATACASTPAPVGAVTHADTDYCSFDTTGLTVPYGYGTDVVVTGLRDTLVS